MTATPSSILALDVGSKRIGVAIASLVARLPRPLTTLDATDSKLFQKLEDIINEEAAVELVVGFPRGLDGQYTAQTASIEAFVEQLQEKIVLPIHLQDEALTSQKARNELESLGRAYTKEDIDALAATYILEDWLLTNSDGQEL